MPKDILQTCREHFESVIGQDYPNNFSVSPWWKNIQQKNIAEIREFKSPQDAIDFAQTLSSSGFDHRSKESLWTTEVKINAIERQFPTFCFADSPELKESDISIPSTLIKVNEIPYSNIFLTQAYYYLRCASSFKNKADLNRVLEIGGGYGGLARIFKNMNPDISYAIVDLPESLFYAEVFLSLNFPEANIAYVNNKGEIDIDSADFLLVPIQFIETVFNSEFDLAINTCSLQEMPDDAVRYFMSFIQSKIKVKRFYSFNYFLNNKNNLAETKGNDSNLICPILDPYWEAKFFEINPLVLTIDTNHRNWLEVLVERNSEEVIGCKNLKEEGLKSFQMACKFSIGSNIWLEKVWMAIWYDPNEQYINEMMRGIKFFKLGCGPVNRTSYQECFDSKSFCGVLAIIKYYLKNFFRMIEHRTRFFFRRREWRDATIYSEEIFYKNLSEKTGKPRIQQ